MNFDHFYLQFKSKFKGGDNYIAHLKRTGSPLYDSYVKESLYEDLRSYFLDSHCEWEGFTEAFSLYSECVGIGYPMENAIFKSWEYLFSNGLIEDFFFEQK